MNKKQRNLIITIVVFIAVIIAGTAAYKFLGKSAHNVSNLSQADGGVNTAETDRAADTSKNDEAENNTSENNAAENNTSENDTSAANTSTETSDTSSDDEATANNIAPDLSFTDMNGNLVNLSDYFDKPVVLNFWATTCPYCLREIPEFDSVYADYKDNVHFIMLNVAGFNGETAQMGMDYVAENNYSLPFYFDTEESVMTTFGLSSLPMTLFLKEGGIMEAYAQGQCDAATLEKGISMILE